MPQYHTQKIRTASLIALPFALMALTPAAHALSMTAENSWSFDGGATTFLDSDGPASSGTVDVLASQASATGSVFYHTYGNDTGNFGSRSSGAGLFDIGGEYSFEESYAASTTSFGFHVVPGELAFSNSSSFTGTEYLTASYFLDIMLNGTSIWSSGATLEQTGSSVSLINQVGTSLGSYTAGSYQYTMNDFIGTLALNSFGAFNTSGFNTINYVLTTAASSNISDCSISTGGVDADGNHNPDVAGNGSSGGSVVCAGAIARIGDPFGVNSVPEPGTIALLGLGIAGLAFCRRRKT